MTNDVIYSNLPKVGDKVAAYGVQLVGHCHCHPELTVHKVVLWEPTLRNRRRVRQMSY